MRLPRVRLSVFWMILAVAFCAIESYVVPEPLKGPIREGYQRCRTTKKRNDRKNRNGKLKLQIRPPDDQRITNTLSQVCRLLSDAVRSECASNGLGQPGRFLVRSTHESAAAARSAELWS